MKKHYLILLLFTAGGMLPGCAKKSSDPVLPKQGTFTFGGAIYSGPTTAETYNGALEVGIAGVGGKTFVIYNMPPASTGSFKVYDTFVTGVLESSTEVYATSDIIIDGLGTGSVSASGNLTKTGARSFIFTGFFQAELSKQDIATVNGSGNY